VVVGRRAVGPGQAPRSLQACGRMVPAGYVRQQPNWQFLLTQVRSRSEAIRLTAHGLGSAAGLRSRIAEKLA
jgi:hypothetical protein